MSDLITNRTIFDHQLLKWVYANEIEILCLYDALKAKLWVEHNKGSTGTLMYYKLNQCQLGHDLSAQCGGDFVYFNIGLICECCNTKQGTRSTHQFRRDKVDESALKDLIKENVEATTKNKSRVVTSF